MFVFDLYLTLSYFVGFVHDYCSVPLVRFFCQNLIVTQRIEIVKSTHKCLLNV